RGSRRAAGGAASEDAADPLPRRLRSRSERDRAARARPHLPRRVSDRRATSAGDAIDVQALFAAAIEPKEDRVGVSQAGVGLEHPARIAERVAVGVDQQVAVVDPEPTEEAVAPDAVDL